jgi:zinc and cadmium transporter
MQELSTLGNILLFTFIGSILSLIGGVLLLLKRDLTQRLSHLLISFAAGTLLGTAFLDLLPEAIESSDPHLILVFSLGGFLSFFILERFVHWLHHHPDPHGAGEHWSHHHASKEQKPTVPLIVFGDSVHNFIDGVAIAATFLVSVPLGVITAFAVAAHEIPQEIGDFAIMLKKGISPRKALLFNFASALTAMIGAILTFYFGSQLEQFLPVFLAVTAGFFIYISASDLIPEIHEQNKRGFALLETGMIFLGAISVYALVSLLEH